MLAPLNVPASATAPGQHPVEHVGHVVGGRYRLEARIAGGAMGSLWRAQHVDLRCAVAIKFLDLSAGSETELHGRFLQEARSTAAVRCAHVVQVFDYGKEGNVPFIVMELLEGETLEQRLSRLGVLSPLELEKIFRDVVSGVSRSHATGVIHRDLKPSNIFIAKEGSDEVTKVIDFGIAKVDEARLGFTPRAGTRAGTVIGTPDYMSPEQLRAGAEVDHSVDLWALAIIAFECLTGKLPFTGKSLTDLVVQICTETPILPSTLARVPAGFDRWFRKATHRDPGSRFSSAEEMAAALSPILKGARPAPLPQEAPGREPSSDTRWLGSFFLDAQLSRLRRAVTRWSWATKVGRAALAWRSPVRAGVALGMFVGVIGVSVIAFRSAPSRPVPTASEAPVPTASAAPVPMASEVRVPAASEPAVPAASKPAVPAAFEPAVPAASAAPVPAVYEATAQPALVVAAAAPEHGPSGTSGVSSSRSEQPAPAITPPSIPSVAESGQDPKPPSAAPQRAAMVNGSGAGEPPKSPAERRTPAPALNRPSRAVQNRALPNPPTPVEANIRPPIPTGEELFAERL